MPRRFSHRLRVRYSECDPQNVVFNAHYVAWFDILMTELWRQVPGGYAAMVGAGTEMVVAQVSVRYLAGAHFDDELDLSASVGRLGNTGMTTHIEVLRGEEALADGELRHVFIDLASKQKRPIPDEVRRALEPYLEPVEAPA
ncbi:MAG: acyl-CoA thioesterase [Actinomycetota bacterium]|nr:acyl-CoA thioesterase [Actinomycetota bacterium]MDQ3719486.1 acyl-CoA thioesterase [Actinomycetota bacterium]